MQAIGHVLQVIAPLRRVDRSPQDIAEAGQEAGVDGIEVAAHGAADRQDAEFPGLAHDGDRQHRDDSMLGIV